MNEDSAVRGQPSGQRLSRLLDKVGVRLAIVLICALTVIYFVAARLDVTDINKVPTLKAISLSFLQDLAANTLPVFVLFVFSYWLLRELDEAKHREEISSVADTVAATLKAELSTPATADRFFGHRSPENPLIEQAQDELLMIQETGSLVFEQCKSGLTNALKRGTRTRMIVVDPSPQSATLLAFRNANMHRDGIAARAKQFAAHLEDLLGSAPYLAERLEVRFCPYPICSTMVMINPASSEGQRSHSLIRLAGFRVPFDDKLDFYVSRDSAPKTFSHYVAEFGNLWRASSKILLVTGEPRAGKTTLFSRLVPEIVALGPIYSCITDARMNKYGKREGFESRTTRVAEPRLIAVRNASGNYEPDLKVIDEIAGEIEEQSRKSRLLIIDEIGPIQLQSRRFANVITTLFDNPSVSLIASISLDDGKHPLLKRFKSHFRADVMRLERQRNDQVILERLGVEASSLLSRPPF